MSKVVLIAIGFIAMQPEFALGNVYPTAADQIDEENIVTARRTIEQVQKAYSDEWIAIPGVEGTGIGLCEGKPCIKIYSSKRAEELRDKIPQTVDGYPVVIEETGRFRRLE